MRISTVMSALLLGTVTLACASMLERSRPECLQRLRALALTDRPFAADVQRELDCILEARSTALATQPADNSSMRENVPLHGGKLRDQPVLARPSAEEMERRTMDTYRSAGTTISTKRISSGLQSNIRAILSRLEALPANTPLPADLRARLAELRAATGSER